MPDSLSHRPKNSAVRASLGVLQVSGVLKYSCAYFLGALALMLIAAPFVERFEGGDIVEGALLSLVLLSAVLAVGGRRRTLLWAIVLVAPALIAKWLNHVRPDVLPAEVYLGSALVFIAFIVVQLLRYILRAPHVNSEVLCAGLASYLMIGLWWGVAYTLVARIEPDAFFYAVGPAPAHGMKGFNALYFSFVTLTTCGYGDIVPISSTVRMLAIVEATVGVLYVAVLISRLVSLHAARAASEREGAR